MLHLIRMYLVKNTPKMGDRKQGLDKIFFKKQSISESSSENSVTYQSSKKFFRQVIK